jgi:uncharacterized protein (DUF302 family)
MDANGLVTLPSRHSVSQTLDRLTDALQAKGVRVFARIDHAEGAAGAGLPLRPTTVVIFGNPAAGTPLMQADQRIGLDLPLKVLVWQDEGGQAWLTYGDPVWLAARFELNDAAAPVARRLADTLAGFAAVATGP